MNQARLIAMAALSVSLALAACATKSKPGVQLAAEEGLSKPPSIVPSGRNDQAMLGLGSQQALAAEAGDRVFFAVDSHVLDDEARAVLAAQSSWLRRRPEVQVIVAGSADERGTREYNFALAARRAAAARDALLAGGVAGDRVATVSYGKERPVDQRSTEEAWATNRNAQTQVKDHTGSW